MTYLVEQVLQPRAFVYTSNVHALVLESTQPETRLTFLNSQRSSGLSPSFSIANSNSDLHILNNNSVISTFNQKYDPIQQEVQAKLTTQGSTHAANFTILPGAGTKAVVLKDFNEYSTNQYAGIEYTGGAFANQLPIRTSRFVFQAAAMDGINAEWVRIQESSIGVPQVGIGTTDIESSVALAVSGNTQISGNTHISGALKVTGAFEFNPTSFSNYIQYDNSTNRLPNTALPTNVPLLDQNNKIDESIIPQTFNFQYMKSQKNVGIGTRYPEQKFHVHGSGVFSERIGIGTLKPVTRLHVLETAGTVPAVRIQNTGGGSLIETLIGNQMAMVVPGTHPGIGIGTTSVPIGTGLYVVGDTNIQGQIHTTQTFLCSNIQSVGKITADQLQIQGNVLKTGLKFSPLLGTVQVVESAAPVILTNELSVNSISATAEYGRVRFRNASISVDVGTYLASQTVTLSDNSIIFNKNRIYGAEAINKIKQIMGYTYNLGASEACAGVVGNELIQSGLTSIVTSMPDGKYGVRYDSIIPYLVECIKNLDERVRILEGL